ncbi:hypothetical protein ACFVSS_25145 [Peribacillus butanolivorans]|uniref:hypothetical protein n=1 Tax=Peribacillus butanolivorans TaxID=421767 RepID=UPI0036DEE046
MKFTYLIGTFTVTSALLLAGCNAKETTVEKEATTVQTNKVEKEKNVELTKEEKIAELPSPYNEIGKHFAEWELPKEGILPKDDPQWNETEPFDGKDPHDAFVYYENGYGFDKKTGYMFTAAYEMDEEGQGEPPEPSPDQREGIIMAIVDEWVYDGDYVMEGSPMYYEDENGKQIEENGKKVPNPDFIANLKLDIEDGGKMDDLLKIRSYAEKDKLKPLEDWANETINYFANASETNDNEECWNLYSKGMDKIEELNNTFKLARE